MKKLSDLPDEAYQFIKDLETEILQLCNKYTQKYPLELIHLTLQLSYLSSLVSLTPKEKWLEALDEEYQILKRNIMLYFENQKDSTN